MAPTDSKPSAQRWLWGILLLATLTAAFSYAPPAPVSVWVDHTPLPDSARILLPQEIAP